ncbi:MAG: right-handed parallel beta-helix repeat-containing protein [Verrucomicrobia bacterium]|nr:right-handed parallel beta-helix repeat-containing protein [Verrucomicrobiota bacterium]
MKTVIRTSGALLVVWAAVSAWTGATVAAESGPPLNADFYVAPDGQDANSGTAAAPFATLARARSAIREKVAAGLDRDLLVLMRGGVYRLEECLTFGPEDSGTGKFAITYAAQPGEKVVLSGGRKIAGWRRAEGEIWTTELPDVKAGTWFFRQLYVNNRRAIRARTPNIDDKTPWWHIRTSTAAILNETPPPEDVPITASVTGPIKAWSNPGDAELVYLANNNASRMPLGSVNQKEQTFILPAPHRWNPRAFGTEWKFSIPTEGLACYLENALEMLDQPGEWYLDRRTGVLSYWPRAGEDLTRDEVVGPVAPKTLLAVIGTRQHPVMNLHFKGLQVEHVKWDMPAWGYMGMACCTVATGKDPNPGWQWVEAAVEYEYARSCSFIDGGIAHVGAIGMCLRKGTADILVQGNEVCDTGGGGIGAGYMENAAYNYVHAPPPEQGEFRGYRIANNYVHDCGMEDYGAFGIEVSEVQDSVIAHNLVHDTAYFGICVAGSQGGRDAPFARNNTVQYNHVHDVMKVTVDGAGLYVTFAHPDRGCVVRGNLFHDVSPNRFSVRDPAPYHAAGIYLDGNAAGYLFENNMVFRTWGGLYVPGNGRDVWLDNFIQKDGSPPPEFIEAVQAHAGLEPAYRRSLLKTESPPCDFYPLTQPDTAANVWSGCQWNRPAEGSGVLTACRRAGSKDDSAQFKLRGLDATATYDLKAWAGVDWDGRVLLGIQPLPNVETVLGEGHACQTGRQLMEAGLLVRLVNRPQVAWIAYQRVKGS